jgi:arylsulfatase
MTGLMPRTHGMVENKNLPMPNAPTLAGCFRDAGYQAYAVGKLHVTPQRQRLGFDDVLLDEEGRGMEGACQDDYELFLGDNGYPGQRFAGGMNNNEYIWRSWHLPEHLHVTNWAAAAMARQIKRRDPLKPGFWYLSFSHPHPPLAPLQAYLDLYRDVDPPLPIVGDWAQPSDTLPSPIQELTSRREYWNSRPDQIKEIRKAFYAQCTHIDHQLRTVIGTLREEGILNETIICFTADHGDMLGNHRMWAKQQMYRDSLRVPMILMGTDGQMRDGTVGFGRTDGRLVGLADVMPTLLSLAGIPIPAGVEGIPMVGSAEREYSYSLWSNEESEGIGPTRMVRDSRFKLIYYAAGNVTQFFDLEQDPDELRDEADNPAFNAEKQRLEAELIDFLAKSESDKKWTRNGELVGLEPSKYEAKPNRGLYGQRGSHWPPPERGSVPWS